MVNFCSIAGLARLDLWRQRLSEAGAAGVAATLRQIREATRKEIGIANCGNGAPIAKKSNAAMRGVGRAPK
jgi:hypothetical protein